MTNSNILKKSGTKSIISFSKWRRHYIRNLMKARNRITKGLIATDSVNQNVKCGDCNACCTNFKGVILLPQEQDKYVTSNEDPNLMAVDENGDCHYLLNGKCSIRDERPYGCRTYDCRTLAFGKVRSENPDCNLGKAILAWDLSGQSRQDRIELTAMRLALLPLLQDNREDLDVQILMITVALVNAHKFTGMATTFVDDPEIIKKSHAMFGTIGHDSSFLMNFLGDE